MIRLYGEVKQCASLYFCIYSMIKRACVCVCLQACVCVYCVEKARKTLIKRDGVNRKEAVGLRLCLKLPILWGVLPHILSHVTEKKKDRLSQRYVALAEDFSCSLPEYKWINSHQNQFNVHLHSHINVACYKNRVLYMLFRGDTFTRDSSSKGRNILGYEYRSLQKNVIFLCVIYVNVNFTILILLSSLQNYSD